MPSVIYIGKKLNYARTEYTFFDDRMEFAEGFFSLNRKVIMLRDVREVTLQRGFLQRPYGLGSIYLATPATGLWSTSNAFAAMGFGNVAASGIIIRDIPDPDENYTKITQLVERNRAIKP